MAQDWKRPVSERATPTQDRTCSGASELLAETLAREDDADGGAFAELALDLAQPSEEGDALAHSEQTEVSRANAGLAPLLCLETMPVVGDVDLERVLVLE